MLHQIGNPHEMGAGEVDPLPHLLALHNRSHAVLTEAEAARMRNSVLEASFGRDWANLQVVRRTHFYQETRLKHSSDNHLVFHIGKPIRVRLGFDGERQSQTLTQGGIIIIPRGSTTDWQWEPLDRDTKPVADFLHVYLKPEMVARIGGEMGVEPSGLRFAESLGVKDPDLWRITETLRREIQGIGAGGRLIADAAASQITVLLLRRHAAAHGVASAAKRALGGSQAVLTPKRLRHVTDYIRENLHCDLSLADLATVAGVSLYHFARLFKNATGYSPYQYLTMQRIERAKILLENPDLPIGRVALMVGYESHSRFTAQFRRLAGITPAKYREK